MNMGDVLPFWITSRRARIDCRYPVETTVSHARNWHNYSLFVGLLIPNWRYL